MGIAKLLFSASYQYNSGTLAIFVLISHVRNILYDPGIIIYSYLRFWKYQADFEIREQGLQNLMEVFLNVSLNLLRYLLLQ